MRLACAAGVCALVLGWLLGGVAASDGSRRRDYKGRKINDSACESYKACDRMHKGSLRSKGSTRAEIEKVDVIKISFPKSNASVRIRIVDSKKIAKYEKYPNEPSLVVPDDAWWQKYRNECMKNYPRSPRVAQSLGPAADRGSVH